MSILRALSVVKSRCSSSIDYFTIGLGVRLRVWLGLWLRIGLGLGLGLRLRLGPNRIADSPDNVVDLDSGTSASGAAALAFSASNIVGLSSVIHTHTHGHIVGQDGRELIEFVTIEFELKLCFTLGNSGVD